jgi:hypothetical protein
MSLTINTKAYVADKTAPDQIVYAGPNDSVSVTDVLGLKRVDPKPVANFDGTARTSAKISRSFVLANGKRVIAIGEASYSIPVGVAQADAEALAADLSAFAGSTQGKALTWKQTISF